jgi:hypothetical protein
MDIGNASTIMPQTDEIDATSLPAINKAKNTIDALSMFVSCLEWQKNS